MLFYVSHSGKEFKVRVESKHGRYQVTLDNDKTFDADMWHFGNDLSYIQNGRVFAANVVGKQNDYTVSRPQGNLQFKVESEYRRIVGSLRGQGMDNESNVVARMPGKITKIMIRPGDSVEGGQTVLVMEAMKMENEVRSTISGEVIKICVSEGQAVESGTLLIEIKPPDEV